MPNDITAHSLPPAFDAIDISALAGVEPHALILDPAQIAVDAASAGRALRYARFVGVESTEVDANAPDDVGPVALPYDRIGFRTFAATPRKGPAPLQTSAWSAMERALNDDRRSNTVDDEILMQQPKLRHRPLALPDDGKFRYTMDADVINLFRKFTNAAGRETEDRWTFSLTDPPEALMMGTSDGDEPLIAAQRLTVALEGTFWLPFGVLLADGCFRRMQDIRSLVVRETVPGAFYCFLSHRWLSKTHPDPDARQAQFAAWQLVAYLAEAVRVADQRGLEQPRQFSAQLGRPVGPRGSDLAEALIVNVLRFALDAETLREAAAETRPLERLFEDRGVAHAATDAGLVALNALLAERPILRGLIDRIYLWYDYSCLTQPPRDDADHALLLKGLPELSAAQILGRTVIMLDDADEYLSRAWCILEALVADTMGGRADLIIGSERPPAPEGAVEGHFRTLVEDRPHVVWRGVLDTEIFGVQDAGTCMNRLGLNVTQANDIPIIYQQLLRLRAPVKAHIDDSSLVTGVLPRPAFENGTLVVRALKTGQAISRTEAEPQTTSLDWTGALSLNEAWNWENGRPALAPPYRSVAVTGGGGVERCHVAVIAGCEGEAVIFANWVQQRRAELEAVLSVTVTSVSWVASDIAPVGHFVVGSLEALPIEAEAWIVVSTSTRLRHCPVAGAIIESLRWSGVQYATLAIDQSENNVVLPAAAEPPEGVELNELIEVVNLLEHPPVPFPGGLYQWQVEERWL